MHRQPREAAAAGGGGRADRQRTAHAARWSARTTARSSRSPTCSKGKEGRFRKNLLGKRVDYSGRSVIVVGPHLKLHQCGLPQGDGAGAVQAVRHEDAGGDAGYTSNIKTAKRMIDKMNPEVWDALEEVISGAPGAAEPRADAAPPRHPGVRAGAGGRQGDPGPPAGLPRLQRGLRRRPDGGPRAALGVLRRRKRAS